MSDDENEDAESEEEYDDSGGHDDLKVLMLGLDGSGKTTILYQFKHGMMVKTIQTIGFNVETVVHKNKKFAIWDLGGQEKIRPLWRHYYFYTEALIFVVDSCNLAYLEEAREKLHEVLEVEELSKVALLVFANKQEMSSALPVLSIVEKLNLLDVQQQWTIMGCSSKSGAGLREGLDYFLEEKPIVNPIKALILLDQMFSCIVMRVIEENKEIEKEEGSFLFLKQLIKSVHNCDLFFTENVLSLMFDKLM